VARALVHTGSRAREARTPNQARPEARVVAVTGACGFLGQELIRRLEENRRYEKVLALDIRPPDVPLEKTRFCRTDLTLPTVDGQIAALLADEAVDTLIHAAFLSYPTHASAWAHELEDIGTMHVLNACVQARPGKVVLCSTTLVYGAHPENPNFLAETHPLNGQPRSRFVQDKVRAEKQVAHFAEENPDVAVAILRFAPLLGPTVTSVFTRFFSRPVAPVLMGYDPLMQFIHEADAVDALELAVEGDVRGAYNIVGDGVLPYTTILALMGKLPLPLPHTLAYSLSRALWATQIFDSPPSFLDFLRFLCVADGAKATRELGFVPRHDLKRTIADFLGVGPMEDDAPDIWRAPG
jgi:UDP-glucose 4-epimerase